MTQSTDALRSELATEQLPQHVAIIMDGNGRWAQRQGMPRIEGHRRGAETVRKIVTLSAQLGLKQLTLYCFSSENWKRPPSERTFLMYLLEKYLIDERSEIIRQQLQFAVIGRTDELSEKIQEEIQKTIDQSSAHEGMRLCLALNYGSRQEIIDAVREIGRQIQAGELSPAEIDEACLSQQLDTGGMPDPDLIIRTAGEMRLSNFLLWQSSYAELWVTEKCWPEFSEAEFLQAMKDYSRRERRYGGLIEEQQAD